MPFTVTLQPSGHRFPCGADTSILDAGLKAGFFIPYSCRSGLCSTCRGRVVSGEVDYGAIQPARLTDIDRAAGWTMLCQARPRSDVVVDVREHEPSEVVQVKTLPVRVLSLDRVALDVMKVVLGVPANEPVVFHAGQYLEVELKDGLRRTYSMANVASREGARQLELHIRHLPGGLFTDRLFATAKVRDLWRVQVPLGAFYLREKSDKPIVMVASGTGFAPIKAIVEHSLAKGLRRPIHLYWGGRMRQDLYMMDLAQGWAQEHAHIRFTPVLSDATPACEWTGRTGFVHRAVLDDHASLSGHQVYACGTPSVIESARRDFTAQRGLPADGFFADSFITAAEKAHTST